MLNPIPTQEKCLNTGKSISKSTQNDVVPVALHLSFLGPPLWTNPNLANATAKRASQLTGRVDAKANPPGRKKDALTWLD